jgi:hypothetical protein
MGITQFITRALAQTAVYWGNPHDNGYGTATFDDPIEIHCRWEDKEQVLGTIAGNQITGYQKVSRAIVYVDRDLDEEGFLYLGTLDDMADSDGDSSGGWYDPHDIVGAYIIKRFEKIPALGSTTEFIRVAYLTPWLT